MGTKYKVVGNGFSSGILVVAIGLLDVLPQSVKHSNVHIFADDVQALHGHL